MATVTIVTPNATALKRITSSPALATGDQIEWDTDTKVTVYDDGTFSVTDLNLVGFSVRVWTTGDGWGRWSLQQLIDYEPNEVIINSGFMCI
jgi:hypothetical protein